MDQQHLANPTAMHDVIRFGNLEMAFHSTEDVAFTFTREASGIRLRVHGMSGGDLKGLIEFMQDGEPFEFRGDRYLITNVEAANVVPLTGITLYEHGVIEAIKVLGSGLSAFSP